MKTINYEFAWTAMYELILRQYQRAKITRLKSDTEGTANDKQYWAGYEQAFKDAMNMIDQSEISASHIG